MQLFSLPTKSVSDCNQADRKLKQGEIEKKEAATAKTSAYKGKSAERTKLNIVTTLNCITMLDIK